MARWARIMRVIILCTKTSQLQIATLILLSLSVLLLEFTVKNLSLKMRRCNKEKLSNFLDKGRHRKFLCMGLLFYIVGLQLTHFIGYLQTPLVTKVCRKI